MRQRDFNKCMTRLRDEKRDKNIRSATAYLSTHAIICTDIQKAEVNGFSMPDVAAIFFNDTVISMIKIEELIDISFTNYLNEEVHILK